MSKPSDMESVATVVEEFSMAVWEEMDAVVEKVDWGVYDVLDTQEGLKRVTFDAEVAQERDDCDFITFGSAGFEELQHTARQWGRVAVATLPYAIGKIPSALSEKIQKLVHLEKCRAPQVRGYQVRQGGAVLFQFHVTYQAADIIEELAPVLLDLGSLADITPFIEFLDVPQLSLTAREDRPSPGPVVPLHSLDEAYGHAVKVVSATIQGRIKEKKREDLSRKEDELDQSRQYYEKTLNNLRKQLKTTADTERADRVRQKIAATEADWKRRQEDIAGAYDLTVDVRLDQVRFYWVPLIRVNAEVQQRTDMLSVSFDYYPWARTWAPVTCPHCYQPTPVLRYSHCGWHCGCV